MSKETDKGLVVVGIAASAGGLEAMSLLLQSLPADLDCAYVVAQHMSPNHESMLVKLLARETRLKVAQIEEVARPTSGTVYITPPGTDVIYKDGVLRALPPSGHPASPKPSADRLFTSLAEELGPKCMALVLSGTGSDGSYGVQAVREAGGITIAQEPGSAKYDSMPISAVRTGCVDLTLTPQQIGKHLAQILSHPRDLGDLKRLGQEVNRNADLFQILLAHTMVDFRQYKESTINRRVHRRMVAKGISSLKDYVDLCRRSQEEVEALYRDLLISVTRFFRDPEQFEVLGRLLKERIERRPGAKMRIWVPGCATGEEAYTIAVLFAEAAGGLEALAKDTLQIFATDIDEHALAVGRKGVYPRNAADDIPPELVEKYFEISGDRAAVRPLLRNCVMFTRHNIFQDAPFMSIDVVSIRNVLIYFDTNLQERVLSRVQYALVHDGLLMLGTSETTGSLEGQFVQADRNARVFTKRSAPPIKVSSLGSSHAVNAGLRIQKKRDQREAEAAENWNRFHALARAVASNGILVDAERNVLKVYGDIAPFVRISDSLASGFSLRILRDGLANEAGTLVLVALKNKAARAGQWHELDGKDFNYARIVAYPLHEEDVAEPLVLLALETELRTAPSASDEERSDYLNYVETELARTREALTVTMEQLQSSNEELQSLNEELQSSNEELQSTNEELETSNEELQSTNEELITVNEELIVNSTELQRTTTEMNGLVDGLPTTMMMLDQGLLIRHASGRAIEKFDLRQRGQSMGHLSQCTLPEGYPALVDLCSQALLDRKFVSRQFESGGQRHNLTIAPLVSKSDELIGLVLMVTTIEFSIEASLNWTLRRFGNIGTWQVLLPSNEVSWSEETYTLHGMRASDGPVTLEMGINYYHPDDRELVRKSIESALKDNSGFHFFARLQRVDDQLIVVESSGTVVTDRLGNAIAIVGVIRDYSRIQTEGILLQHYNEIAYREGIGVFSYDIVNGLAYWNPQLYRILEIDPKEGASIDLAMKRLAPESAREVRKLIDAAITHGEAYNFEGELLRRAGGRVPYRSSGRAHRNDEGKVTHLYGTLRLAEK